jgi:hypothetical protein
VIREADETKSFETACLARKTVSIVNNLQREAYEVIKSLETRLESAIRIGDVAVDITITLRRIADSLYYHQLRAAESADGVWKHSRTKQAAVESRHENSTLPTSGNRSGWI